MHDHRQDTHTFTTHTHMMHTGRGSCTCSRPGPIASYLCSLSAIVLLVPVLSSSLSLPLYCRATWFIPFLFVAQPVFSPSIVDWLYAFLIQLHTALFLCFAHSPHWPDLATISHFCETTVVNARSSLWWSPFYLLVFPISLAVLHLTSPPVQYVD